MFNFGSKEKKSKESPSGCILPLFLIIIVVVAIILIGLIIFEGELPNLFNNNQTQKPLNYKSTINSFVTNLNADKNSNLTSHRNLYNFLQSNLGNNQISNEEIKNYIETIDIPYDYKYFFNTCIPAYFSYKGHYGKVISDNNIIVSLPRNKKYTAQFVFNKNNASTEKILNQLEPCESKNRIILTGTYTSPFAIPTGLCIINGEIINPALQKWNGLLILNKDRQLNIYSADDLTVDFKDLKIKTNYNDYIDFVEKLKQDKLSVIQSHLILYKGNVLIENNPQEKKFRRRIIFQTADNSIHIYDSFDKEVTLFDIATSLHADFKAVSAINLDMGTYNFCKLFTNNTLSKNYSELGKNIIISNFMTIDYN